MLLDGRVVVENEVLPVGTEAHHLVAVVVSEVVWVDIENRHALFHTALVLQNGVIHGTRHVAPLPSRLPAVREVVVDLSLALLSFLGGDENHTIGGTCTIDGTRGSVFQHFNRLDVRGVHAFHTVLVGGHTVYNIKRSVPVGINGAVTTNTDERL